MIRLPEPVPRDPHRFRIAYAIREMRDRLGDQAPLTDELYNELATKYELTPEQLKQAWIKAMFE